MNVKNIKSFIDFYKSLEISTCIAPFPRFLDKKDQKKLITKKSNTLEERNFTCKKKDEKLKELIEEIKTSKCDLKDVATNTVFSDGPNDSKIMLIGEAPGADDDRIGKPFVGQAGQLLDKMFDSINLSRKKNFYITNLVFWRPPGNRTPNEQEISTCLPLTKKHISIINPRLLILLGNVASQSILSSKERINVLRKRKNYFIDKGLGLKIPVKTIFHPAYLLRNPIEKKTMWTDLLDIDEFILTNNII
jgi:DNA polymerase